MTYFHFCLGFQKRKTIVMHVVGGLGTTAEALKCGIPVIVTGVLLMDQRFWGCRCFELGVGKVFVCKFVLVLMSL